MKKIIITLAFSCLIGATATFAQKVNGVAVKDFTVEYIEIAEYPSTGASIRVRVDYGQKGSLWSNAELILTDNDGKQMYFSSIIAALNFMSQNGYELVSTYTVKSGDNFAPHFVLKKKKN